MIDAATFALNNKSGMETTLTSSVEVGLGLKQAIESKEIIFKNLLHSLFKPEMEVFTDEGFRQLVEAEGSLPAGNILPPLLELLTDDIDAAELIKDSGKDDLTSGKGILQSPVTTQVLSLLDDAVKQVHVLKPVNNFSNVDDYHGRLLHKEVQFLDQGRATEKTEMINPDLEIEVDRGLLLLNRLINNEGVKTLENLFVQSDRTNAFAVTGTDVTVPRQNAGIAAGQNTVKLSIDSTLKQPGWGDSLAGRISMMITEKHHSAQINLNPPELGQVEVRIKVNNDQANINFYAHHADVRDAIEEAFPKLRELLNQSGLSLGDANISQHSFSQQQNSEEINEAAITYNEENGQESAGSDSVSEPGVTVRLIDQFV